MFYKVQSIFFLSFLGALGFASVEAGSEHQISGFKKFDWSEVLEVPPGTSYVDGNQILHFKSKNKPFTDDKEAFQFFKSYLSTSVSLTSDADVLRFASDHVTIEGAYIEVGVCTGKTINFIAALNPQRPIHGFDSFEGLPEDWKRTDKVIKKGTFGFKNTDRLPPVLHNVFLYPGWFKDTLPRFKKEILKDSPIALLHIDCDIYSSTKEVLRAFKDNIQEGTILVFDELYNYPGYEIHEWKALQEFLEEKDFQAEFLAFNANHEQVALKIRNKTSEKVK